MKNTILAFVGLWIMLIGTVSILTLSERGIRRNQLENQVSRAMKEAFYEVYVKGFNKEALNEEQILWKAFEKHMRQYPSGKGHYTIKRVKEDSRRGILSVVVEGKFKVRRGATKVICVKKTMIKESKK